MLRCRFFLRREQRIQPSARVRRKSLWQPNELHEATKDGDSLTGLPPFLLRSSSFSHPTLPLRALLQRDFLLLSPQPLRLRLLPCVLLPGVLLVLLGWG